MDGCDRKGVKICIDAGRLFLSSARETFAFDVRESEIRFAEFDAVLSMGNCPLKVSISTSGIKGSLVCIRHILPLLVNAISTCFHAFRSRNYALPALTDSRRNSLMKRAFNDTRVPAYPFLFLISPQLTFVLANRVKSRLRQFACVCIMYICMSA